MSSSGWRSDESYDEWENEVRQKEVHCRTNIEQLFLDSIDEMRQEEIAGHDTVVVFAVRAVVIVWVICIIFGVVIALQR